MTVDDCELIKLRVISELRGDLAVVEGTKDVPFDIMRIYYLFNVPAGSIRGGHAHRNLQQVLIALSGSFDVILDDGDNTKRIQMNRPNTGLWIRPMIWRTIENFSSNAVCLVLASDFFDRSDYFYDYETFLEHKSSLS